MRRSQLQITAKSQAPKWVQPSLVINAVISLPSAHDLPTRNSCSKGSLCQVEPAAEFMCEWDGCASLFATASSVLSHVAKEHIAEDGEQVCQWPGCDGTLRSRLAF